MPLSISNLLVSKNLFMHRLQLVDLDITKNNLKNDRILLPNSKASLKTKNKSENSSDFVELISSKLNWATVSDRF
jgi:hypothetical protein